MSVMIQSIEFKNYRSLKDSLLPLSQFTLLVGPNGTGKTTALSVLRPFDVPLDFERNLTKCSSTEVSQISLVINFANDLAGVQFRKNCSSDQSENIHWQGSEKQQHTAGDALKRAQVYSLSAQAMRKPVQFSAEANLLPTGANLANVLDRLRDEHPERFEAVNGVLAEWLPEFDRVLFDTPADGKRAIMLRLRASGQSISAEFLSDGTLLALALLTLAYLPDPPPIIGLEEPDRGIHPRLLREVRDALYRLSYPQEFGEDRKPVQVIATTHSPYMLDLFRDHPEEVVIAQKAGDNVRFQRLSDLPNIEELLGDTPLGEAWYSGILGGVPTGS